MNKSLIKCNIIWFVLAIIVGFTVLSTLKPDLTKKWLTENTEGFVDAFNLKKEPKTTIESYIKRDRSYDEPTVFGEEE